MRLLNHLESGSRAVPNSCPTVRRSRRASTVLPCQVLRPGPGWCRLPPHPRKLFPCAITLHTSLQYPQMVGPYTPAPLPRAVITDRRPRSVRRTAHALPPQSGAAPAARHRLRQTSRGPSPSPWSPPLLLLLLPMPRQRAPPPAAPPPPCACARLEIRVWVVGARAAIGPLAPLLPVPRPAPPPVLLQQAVQVLSRSARGLLRRALALQQRRLFRIQLRSHRLL